MIIMGSIIGTTPCLPTAYLAEENEHESMKWLDVEFRDFFL